jgi:hypothetical protein
MDEGSLLGWAVELELDLGWLRLRDDLDGVDHADCAIEVINN